MRHNPGRGKEAFLQQQFELTLFIIFDALAFIILKQFYYQHNYSTIIFFDFFPNYASLHRRRIVEEGRRHPYFDLTKQRRIVV